MRISALWAMDNLGARETVMRWVFLVQSTVTELTAVRNQCRFCCNTIYNSSPLSLLKDKKQIDRLQPEVLRLAFTSESAAQTGEVLDAYVKTFLHQEPVELEGEFTRGHFKRGVE